MAANWEAKSFELSDINGGNRYENGDSPDASAINAAIEGAGYAVKMAEGARASAASAEESATNAEESAISAEQQVSSAQQSAANAEAAASEAKTSAANAEISAAGAERSASSAQSDAEDAKKSATNAKNDAKSAQVSAETSQGNAEQAKADAAEAASYAQLASDDASASRRYAEQAQADAMASREYQEETREQVSYLAKKISNIQEGLPNMPFVVDETTAYEKKVPANALPYAYIGDICGRTILPANANYFDVSKVTSEQGDMYVQNGVVSVNNPQGTMTQLTLKQICPDIEVGKTYRISCKTNYNGSSMHFGGISVGGNSYATFTATDDILNSKVEFYPEYTFENQVGSDEYRDIMLSYGSLAQSFVPYFELQYSNNLFDISAAKALEQTYDMTVNTAVNVASIKSNSFGGFYLPLSPIVRDFAVGKTYTLSFNRKSETSYSVGISGGTIVTTNGRDQDSGSTYITFIVNSAGASLDFIPSVDVGGDPFFGERFMLSEGSYAESYIQFGKWADAKVTRIESLDKNGNVIYTLNLANLQGLEAYGKGSAGRYNTVSFGVYEPYARYIQRTSKYNQSLSPEVTTDISNLISPYENIILVSPNGKVVAVNENKIPVKFVVGYQTEA